VLFNSARTANKVSFNSPPQVAIVARGENLAHAYSVTPGGRLTLASGVPETTTDMSGTGATTLYYAPGANSTGDVISLYDGANWVSVQFAETAFSLSGLALSTCYDVWGRIDAGALALDTTAWTSDTARATAIAQQNGIDVKSGDPTRRLLGTIRTTTIQGQTEDSRAKRYVSNRYNEVSRPMQVNDPASTWTYSAPRWRQANGNTANQLDYVCCVARPVQAMATGCTTSTVDASVATGIGIDAVPAASNAVISQQASVPPTGHSTNSLAYFAGTPGVGRHFLTWLEYGFSSGTQTWLGTVLPWVQSGIIGTVNN
jgi:hypothetical protein